MTFPRVLHILGLVSCVLVIIACFMPWTYYPNDPSIPTEAERTFTGFYTFKNYYGRPGKFLVAFAAISLVLRLLPKVWAKRTDLFLSAVILAYGLRCYFEFTGNYNGIVPIVKPAMYIILIAPLVMQAAAIFPDLKIRVKR
jgi:hypothetical protein